MRPLINAKALLKALRELISTQKGGNTFNNRGESQQGNKNRKSLNIWRTNIHSFHLTWCNFAQTFCFY